MDNDALVAALGPDAVAAVHGYRLAVLAEAGRRGLRTWGPARGWSSSHRTASGPLRSYAGPAAAPSDLVPTPQQVLDWASTDVRGAAAPPVGVELDDDPVVIRRLLDFADPQEHLPATGGPVPAPDEQRTGPDRSSGGRARASS